MSDILLDLGFGDWDTTPTDFLKVSPNSWTKPDLNIDWIRQLPYCDQTVTAIRTAYSLESVRDLVFLSNEIHRVLVPGGQWLIKALPNDSPWLWSNPTQVRSIGPNFNLFVEKPNPVLGLNGTFITDLKTVDKHLQFELHAVHTFPSIGSLAHQKHGELALDLGCGDTHDLEARYGEDLFNLDKNWTLLGLGIPNLIIRDVDQHGLPFCDDSAKFIRARDFFEHCRNFTGLMNDCYRVLKDGGILDIKGPAPYSDFDIGNPDHCRQIGPYSIDHFLYPIINAGIHTRFKIITNKIEGPFLFATLTADKSSPIPPGPVYSSERCVS